MRDRNDEGAVTAETAVALPVVVLFALSLAWLLSLGFVQVRAIDAARETARVAARGEDSGRALAVGRQVATRGSQVSVRRAGGTVVASVSSPVSGPAGLFAHWAGFRVRARAVAAVEPGAEPSR